MKDIVINMYEYRVFKKQDPDYYTRGYVFAKSEDLAKEIIVNNFPNDIVEIQLESNIMNGTILMGVSLDD